MKDPTTFPLALSQANAQLLARIAELARTGGQQWYELVQRLVNDGLVEGGTEVQEILRAQDWQRLLSRPADACLRQLQQRFGDQQATTQIVVAAQASFARGLQDALAAWQRDTIAALDQAGLASPALGPEWSQLFAGWEAVLPNLEVVVTPWQVVTPEPSARPAPARKPAAKKTPAARPAAKPTAKRAGAAARKPVRKASAGKPATKATKAVKKSPAKKPANKTPARKAARKPAR